MKIRMQPKVALQILLLLSGDIERCPGPEENEVRLDFDRILRCKGLKLFHLNIRGLWTNLSNISQIFSDNKNIDILSLGETHIADEPGEMYTIDGYTFVNRPRKNGKGGGVACYVHDNINWIRRFDLESKDLECLWLEIIPAKSKSFLLAVMYKPPEGSRYLQSNFINLLNDMLSLATKSNKETIIMGDLNVNYLDKSDHKEIKSVFNLIGFKQVITEATRTTENTATLIDVIQTNNPQVISTTTVIPIAFSDHDLIACVRKLNHRSFNPKTIICRNYKNYSAEAMSENISSHEDYGQVLNEKNINICWNKLKGIITSCLDEIAPKITKRIRGQPSPWMSVEIKTHMNKRDILLRKSRKTKHPEDIVSFKRKRNQVNSLVKHAKKVYFKEQLENSAHDSNRFWNTLKRLYPSKSTSTTRTFKINGELNCDKKSIAKTFSSYFSTIVCKMKKRAFALRDCIWTTQSFEPLRTCRKFKFKPVTENTVKKEIVKLKRKKATGLDGIPTFILKDCAEVLKTPLTNIVNNSLSSGIYPTDWKISKLIPVFKSGSSAEVENYRPISVIPAVSKIIERIIHRQFSVYLEESDLLTDCQFGFRRKRSTELAATLFVDNIKSKVNDGAMVGAVFIDLSKAFDTISHSKLLQKLEMYGVTGVELAWFSDYLFNRNQRVQYDNFLSSEEKVFCGVPQGSIIGPLLFVLFYNDFPSCLKHAQCIIYADDTVIYVPGKDIFIIQTRLSADMDRISSWCIKNELILNLKKGKTEAMLFGTSKKLAMQSDTLHITFAYENINYTTSYKYLGIEVDPTLNLNSYLDKTYKKSTGRLKILYKIRPYIDSKCAKVLYQSMILPLFTYCGTLQLNYSKTQQKRLHSFHRRGMDLVKSSDNVPSPIDMNKVHSLIIVHRCVHDDVCGNFKKYFEIVTHIKTTRNVGSFLKLRKLKLEYARSSFYYMGASLFNALPHSIRIIDNVDEFQCALHRHFFG